jgi:hypothetical protein
VNSGYFTIRKGDGVEARCLMRVLAEPEADRVLRVELAAEDGFGLNYTQGFPLATKIEACSGSFFKRLDH